MNNEDYNSELEEDSDDSADKGGDSDQSSSRSNSSSNYSNDTNTTLERLCDELLDEVAIALQYSPYPIAFCNSILTRLREVQIEQAAQAAAEEEEEIVVAAAHAASATAPVDDDNVYDADGYIPPTGVQQPDVQRNIYVHPPLDSNRPYDFDQLDFFMGPGNLCNCADFGLGRCARAWTDTLSYDGRAVNNDPPGDETSFHPFADTHSDAVLSFNQGARLHSNSEYRKYLYTRLASTVIPGIQESVEFPHCVVARVRQIYPSVTGYYTGYQQTGYYRCGGTSASSTS